MLRKIAIDGLGQSVLLGFDPPEESTGSDLRFDPSWPTSFARVLFRKGLDDHRPPLEPDLRLIALLSGIRCTGDDTGHVAAILTHQCSESAAREEINSPHRAPQITQVTECIGFNLVGRVGIEPTTFGLKVRGSAN